MVRGGKSLGGKWYDTTAVGGLEREMMMMTMMWSAQGTGLGSGLAPGLGSGSGEEQEDALGKLQSIAHLRSVVDGLSMRRQWAEEAWALDKYTQHTLPKSAVTHKSSWDMAKESTSSLLPPISATSANVNTIASTTSGTLSSVEDWSYLLLQGFSLHDIVVRSGEGGGDGGDDTPSPSVPASAAFQSRLSVATLLQSSSLSSSTTSASFTTSKWCSIISSSSTLPMSTKTTGQEPGARSGSGLGSVTLIGNRPGVGAGTGIGVGLTSEYFTRMPASLLVGMTDDDLNHDGDNTSSAASSETSQVTPLLHGFTYYPPFLPLIVSPFPGVVLFIILLSHLDFVSFSDIYLSLLLLLLLLLLWPPPPFVTLSRR